MDATTRASKEAFVEGLEGSTVWQCLLPTLVVPAALLLEAHLSAVRELPRGAGARQQGRLPTKTNDGERAAAPATDARAPSPRSASASRNFCTTAPPNECPTSTAGAPPPPMCSRKQRRSSTCSVMRTFAASAGDPAAGNHHHRRRSVSSAQPAAVAATPPQAGGAEDAMAC